MEGTLTASGDVGTTAEVIQSVVLGDAAIPRPSGTGMAVAGANTPNVSAVTTSHTEGSGSHAEGSVFQYRLVPVDSNGKESPASSPISVTVPAGNTTADNSITLNNLPTGGTQYSQMRVYRTANGGSNFFLLGTATPGGTFTDDNSVALSSTALNTTELNGNYSYMITYYKAGEPESRPSPLLGPQNIVNGRIHLSGFPTPPTPPSGGGFPAYDSIRIYRNLSNDPNTFYLVDTVPPGTTYTDSKTDAQIKDLNVVGNKTVDLDGPVISSNTLLTNLVRRDGFDYSQPFVEGTLAFRGRKGGRALEEQTFTITSTSTVQDLTDFIQDALGINTDSGDSQNPIPTSVNVIQGETGTLSPGAYIINGRLRFVANNGEDNAIDIDLTSFRITDADGDVTTPNMGFGSVQQAVGTSAVADFVAYDSLGIPIRVRVTAVMESRDDTKTTYRWYADSADNSPRSGNGIAVGTGLISFDGNGNFISSTSSTVAIDRVGMPSTSPLEFDLNFENLSGLASDKASLAASRQDGSPPGKLTSYIIGEDGSIRGVFSNGISRDLGQIRLARFSNPQGLEQRGQNLYAQGINTGLPIEGQPGENGIGSIAAGALELSNSDIGGDLVNLVLASTQYRSNTRVITTTQQLFDELLNLRR
ncbi:MAG: flagellar hook-basal body complex protein [Pirellulales bacterium]